MKVARCCSWGVIVGVVACAPRDPSHGSASSRPPSAIASSSAAEIVSATAPISSSAPPAAPVATGPDAKRCAAYAECTPCEVNDCGWCGNTGLCLPLDQGAAICGPSFSRASSGCTASRAQQLSLDAEGAKWVSEMVAGLQPEGAAIVGRVESPEAFHIPIKRGRCYVLTAHVPYGTWVEFPSRAFAYPQAPHIGGGEWENRSQWSAMRKICPQADGEIVAWLGGYDPPKTKLSKGPGQGPWSLQLYSTPIRESELKSTARRDQQEKDDALARAFCAACYRDYASCKWRGDPGCMAEYAECLRGNRLTPQSCEEGHFAVPSGPQPPPRPDDGGRDL